jgi:Uma2 family endonuclease
MWEGLLHLVPQPSNWHQEFGFELGLVLGPIAMSKGLRASHETSLYRSKTDYRVPDLAFSLPSQRTERGIEGGAELVVEILSPDDESHDKLPFYSAFPVREVLILDPDTRAIELFTLRGGKYHAVAPDEEGLVRSTVLGIALATRGGPKLEIRTLGGTTTI